MKNGSLIFLGAFLAVAGFLLYLTLLPNSSPDASPVAPVSEVAPVAQAVQAVQGAVSTPGLPDVRATDIYWAPTHFKDGSEAVIYFTDQFSNDCPWPGPTRVARAVARKDKNEVNGAPLCWMFGDESAPFMSEAGNDGDSITIYKDADVQVVPGVAAATLTKFQAEREKTIKKATDNERPEDKADSAELGPSQEQVNEQVINPYSKYQNTNSLAN